MASPDLFSTELDRIDEDDLEPELQEAIHELREAFPGDTVESLGGDGQVVLPLNVAVDLPSRGPVDGVDIRETEPIFLVLDRRDYPYRAPAVFSNRRDFPSAYLPHINPGPPGAPASLCLHRGNLDDWFAEHTIVEFVERVRGWLRDAAMDNLMREEDGFEPTRASVTVGIIIYDQLALTHFVKERWRKTGGEGGFAFLWHEYLCNPGDPRAGADAGAVRLVAPLPIEMFSEPQDELTRLANEVLDRGSRWEDRLIGILVWPPEDQVASQYFAELPDKLVDLLTLAKNFGVPLRRGLEEHRSKGLRYTMGPTGTQETVLVPVTLAVPRPQKLIGTDTTLELLDFAVEAGDRIRADNKSWSPKAVVARLGHRTPLVLATARKISSRAPDADLGKLLFFGCGAVGSKLILHLARSGQGSMTLVDEAQLSPHNMVRHGLSFEGVGKNKAEALKEAIEGVFYADDITDVMAINDSALSVLRGDRKGLLDEHSWLIDATAASSLLDVVSQAELPEGISCCRVEIADEGRLGFLSVEGPDRSPRLDDLRAALFDQAIVDDDLSRWLRENRQRREREFGAVLEEINVGLSCSSETMRLADEDVSLHAAAFSRGFRHAAKGAGRNGGGIQISRLDSEGAPGASVGWIDVAPVTVLRAKNDPDWEIRLKGGLERNLVAILEEAAPAETGGLLVGFVSLKTKTVYVTRALSAPLDSMGSPGEFVRGVEGVPEEFSRIAERTGGVLHYVGDWHSHPGGGPKLSHTDEETADDLRHDLRGASLPAHLIVATDGGLHPYVFAPE